MYEFNKSGAAGNDIFDEGKKQPSPNGVLLNNKFIK